VHVVNESNETGRRWPPLWLIALAGIGLYWLALGRRHVEDISGNPIEALPFVLAGLGVVAAIGLLSGGLLGRVVAALIALAGAAWALFTVLFVAVMIITDAQSATSLSAWGFLAIFLGIAAGYGLVPRSGDTGSPDQAPAVALGDRHVTVRVAGLSQKGRDVACHGFGGPGMSDPRRDHQLR
jgi:hypothetical protein